MIEPSSEEYYEMWCNEGCFYYLWRIANGYLPYFCFGDFLCLDEENNLFQDHGLFMIWKLWKP